MVTQNVMGESIAHPDKTRGYTNTMTTVTFTEVKVKGARVVKGEMTARREAILLDTRGIEIGVEVRMEVEKGRIRS